MYIYGIENIMENIIIDINKLLLNKVYLKIILIIIRMIYVKVKN